MPSFPTLTIHLPALRANYRMLRERHAKQACAAVVKANAYGLGVAEISATLAQEGCRLFFVATLEEAIALRASLPRSDIAVFNGIAAKEEKEFAAHRIIPVINTPEQLARIQDSGFGIQNYMVHIDTGMTRLGLSASDLTTHASRILNHGSRILMVLSHLACANDPDHPKNAEQLKRFQEALTHFPGVPASFANSSGHFLDPSYHFDIGRPGCALYGINPTDHKNPMQHVATLSAPILQIRTLDRDEDVGYGATFHAPKGSRIAITALGYADGYFRSLSNRGSAIIAGHTVPMVGRVSMDMIALDISHLPESMLAAGPHAEFINEKQTVDVIAQQCDTIGYEVFTGIGQRVKRIYL